MSSVFANGRTIIHKGDGYTQASATPDPCKTPSPGGPVPVPYPNFASDSDLSEGSKKTKIEGNPIALKTSKLSTSTGDEGGTAGGGIISSKTKGKLTWVAASIDVKVEGKGVVRFMDICLHNGNMSNAGSNPDQGKPEKSLVLVEEKRCLHCGKPLDDKVHKGLPPKTDNKTLMQEANKKKGKGKKVGGIKVESKQVIVHSGDGYGFSKKLTKICNLKTKKPLQISPAAKERFKSMASTVGGCCEQKLLQAVFGPGKMPFPPKDGIEIIEMGIAKRIKGTPTPKELDKVEYAEPCKTCEHIMVAMMCTEKQRPIKEIKNGETAY